MTVTRFVRTGAAASSVVAALTLSALSGAAVAVQPAPDVPDAGAPDSCSAPGAWADLEGLMAQRHHLMTAAWFAGLS